MILKNTKKIVVGVVLLIILIVVVFFLMNEKNTMSQIVEYNGGSLYIQAVPDTGYDFVKWSNNAVENPKEVFYIGEMELTPIFKKKELKKDGFSSNGRSITCEDLEVGDIFNYNNLEYLVVDNKTIREIDPDSYNFSHICTSHVTDFSSLFENSDFSNKDIGSWDTSNAVNMSSMFKNAKNFNEDIGLWDTSNVKFMNNMFQGAKSFNLDLGLWNVENVQEMGHMFFEAESFNQNLSSWCTPHIHEKPYNFDKGSAFEGQNDRQPNWGKCLSN